MDFFDFLNFNKDKPTAWTNGLNRLRTFARLIRTAVEVFLAVAIIAWAFYRLPFALKISGEFLRRLVPVVASPLFVFILGNAIVAALVARFRAAFSADNADESPEEELLYDAVVKTAGEQTLNSERDDSATVAGGEEEEEEEEENDKETVVYEDKVIIIRSQAGEEEKPPADWSSDSDSDSESDSVNPKVYRRARSEKGMVRRRENRKALRRCETTTTTPGMGQSRAAEEELSDEEFQRAVDDFIAKHRKLLRQESLALVVVNPNPTTDLNSSPAIDSVGC